MSQFRLFVFSIALGALLAGCAGPSPRPPSPLSAELEQRLSQLSPRAQLKELDSRASGASSPDERAYYQLLAMELLMEHGRSKDVRQRMNSFNRRALEPGHHYRVELLDAQLALANNRAPVALQRLPKFDSDYPPSIQAALLRTRAIALSNLGHLEESLNTRLKLDRVLQTLPDKTPAIEDNHQVIWSTLQTMPADALNAMQETGDDILHGWVELALALNSASEEGIGRETAISNWQSRFPRHPAAKTLGKTLRGDADYVARYPASIALLLPLNGRYSGPAAAIREGFLASYFNHDSAERPAIRIYDTGQRSGNIDAHYRTAVADGAQLVVGPLQKDAVAELAAVERLSVPVLALNYAADDQTSANMVQFGLRPEDEARQAAELSIIKNQTNALVFAPNNDYGARLSAAFAERYRELGGHILEVEKYSPDTDDHSRPIQRALNVLQSRNRHSILRSVTKRSMKFEPRRRQDVSSIFLIANSRQARNFRAQLKFHGAGDVSLYATSQAYAGVPDPRNDRDLDGLVFTDMPWTLQGERNTQFATIQQHWPAQWQKYTRLYALGIDAYRIIPYLARLRNNPFERFPGLTGSIALDADNRAHRELLWATFIDGTPQILEFSSAEDHSLTDSEDDPSYLNGP
jgi:outer membrane PBP1 activator LpoA protein